MKIQLELNGEFHKDLCISIPEIGLNTYVDTYYFLIDNNILPNDETEEKIVIILKWLLQEWINNVDNLPNEGITFLPYDFSDQYLGALKVKRQGQKLVIRNTWNRELGSMYPSNYGRVKMIDEDFNVLLSKMEIYIEEFIYNIKHQITNLQNN